MKKTINKIIFIFALVILVNIIPTEAKAATISYTFADGQTVNIVYTMITHVTAGSTESVSTIAYRNDKIILDISPTFTYSNHGTYFYGSLVTNTGGTLYGAGNVYFYNESQKDSLHYDVYYPLLTGSGSIRFTVPNYDGTFYIRVKVVSGAYNDYKDIPFTVSPPTVNTKVYWCNVEGTNCSAEIPQNSSKVTTSAVTPGTPLKFTYQATAGLNQGFTCIMPNGSTFSPTLNTTYNYPPTGTVVAQGQTTVFPFLCNNPKVLSVNTWVDSMIGTGANLSTLVMPTSFSSADRPTEIGFSYWNATQGMYYDGYTYGTKSIVCTSPNCTALTYQKQITGLASSSSYFVQSYAKNALGTTLGNTRQITLP